MNVLENRYSLLAVGVVAWLGHPGSVSAAVPPWCGGATFDGSLDLKDLSSPDAAKVVVTFAHALCAPTPEAEAHRAEIDAGRTAWGKRLGMIEADWADAVAYASAPRNFHLTASTKSFAAFTPIDQYVAISDGFTTKAGYPMRDPFYLADALELRLTEVGRLALITACLRFEGLAVGDPAPGQAVPWALCQGDLERFDAGKLATQLRADTAHGGEQRMAIRLQAYELPAQLKAHAARVKELLAKDAAYPKVFETVAKARADWAQGLGTDTRTLELVELMDSATFAQSRKQFEGCEATTAAALTAAISTVPAATFKDMKDVRDNPNSGFATAAGPALLEFPAVNLAAIAYIQCQPTTGISSFLSSPLHAMAGYRGPRTAALTRILRQKVVLDDINAHLTYPDYQSRHWEGGGGAGSAGGVVASVKPEGDVVVVRLERLMVKRTDCVKSHRTGRVSRVRADGTVEYETVCDRSAVVAHDETWADFKVAKEFAPLLQKGVMFSSVNGPRGAEVIAIWPTGNASVPSRLLGVVVK